MNKGFTLVELLVAVTVFATVATIAFGITASLIHKQERIMHMHTLMENSSYALEYIQRATRMAQKDDGGCIVSGENYEHSDGDSTIQFLDYENFCHGFSLGSGQIQETISTDDTYGNLGSAVAFTSDEVDVTSLIFNLSGESGVDSIQPRVTIEFEASSKYFPDVQINVQSTSSQRNLDL